MRVSDITDVDLDFVANVGNVEEVASILWNEAVTTVT